MPSTASESAANASSAPLVREPLTLSRWLAPLLYVLVTLGLFHEFVFSSAMLFGSDTESLGYMVRAFYAERLAAGDFPLWFPNVLGGTPFIDSLAGGDSLYPPSVLLLMLFEPHRALGWKLVLHVFVAGLAMNAWCRELGRTRAASLLMGLAYMLAPFFVTLAFGGHDGKMFVVALTPLLFWAVESWFARRSLTALAATAAVVALVILTPHFQMAWFLFLATGAYALFRSVQVARAEQPRAGTSAFGLFLLASVLGAAAAGIQLLPAVDYVTSASRRTATTVDASPAENRAYASSWGLHPEEIVATLAVPEFVGGDVSAVAPGQNGRRSLESSWVDGTYWGQNPFKINHEYVGFIVVLLALLAVLSSTSRRPLLWFFVSLAGVSLLYTLGTHTPVWGLFYALVPGIKLFRAPSMMVFLTGFSLATIAAFGIDRLLQGAVSRAATRPESAGSAPPDPAERGLWAVAALMVGAWLLATNGVLTSAWTAVFRPDLTPDRAQVLAGAVPFIARGFAIAALLATLLAGIALATRRRWLQASGVVALLGVLLLVDAVRVDLPFIQMRDFEAWAAPSPNERFLMDRKAQQAAPFRVLDMNGGSQAVRLAMFGIDLAAGHHPNDMARYRTLIGMEGSGLPLNLLAAPSIGELLNVQYLVWPAWQYGPLEGQLDNLPGFSGVQRVTGTRLSDGRDYEVVYELPRPLPRARFVTDARAVASDAEAVDLLMRGSVDPRQVTLLAPEWSSWQGQGGDGGERLPGTDRDVPSEAAHTLEWVASDPDLQILRVTAQQPGFLVVADNWFPSWQADIDGVPVDIARADVSLRAIQVPAGEHTITFRATLGEPVRRGGIVGVMTSLALILLVIAGRRKGLAAAAPQTRGATARGAPEGVHSDVV